MCGFLAAGSSEFAPKAFADALAKLNDRGPDMTRTISMDDKVFGFNRLAIMDLSERGMQPFVNDDCILVCNGEIYNYYALEKNLAPEYEFVSNSDCEVLIPLYKKYGPPKNMVWIQCARCWTRNLPLSCTTKLLSA